MTADHPDSVSWLRPVLYLDIDDTLVSWAEGEPRAAPGARQFLLWALERFQLRWLTTWCPDGEMGPALLADLCRMLELDTSRLQDVRGLSWSSTATKLNGIAWLEHLVWGRPFLWVEDEYGFKPTDRRFLAEHGLLDGYRHCNVSCDTGSLQRLHQALACEWREGRFAGWAAQARRAGAWKPGGAARRLASHRRLATG